MTRRWTPQRFVTLRRTRVIICVVAMVLATCTSFLIGARKAVALDVNGETTHVVTYASTAMGVLRQQGVDVKTHDIVQSSSGETLTNNATVTVKSAYQITMSINGQTVPFWTTADSAAQLLGYYEMYEKDAAKVTVDVKNIYNQLTGGIIINADGPVTVIADGKESVYENGNLPAASILDAKGITLGKDDRVSVSQSNGQTFLRVQRVTHGEETRTEPIAYTSRTVVDNSLQPGETKVVQVGENGEKTCVYNVTYVDGVAESESLTSENVTKTPIDEVIAVGPAASSNNSNDADEKADSTDTSNDAADSNDDANKSDDKTDTSSDSNTSNDTNDNNDASSTPSQSPSASPTQSPSTTPTQTPTQTPTPTPTQSPSSGSSGSSSTDISSLCRLYHPSVATAQAYAAAAAGNYGWSTSDWECLKKLWMRESSWRWNAENPSSGAYGIPQSLPASKMASFGQYYRDDGAVQIDWGLSYIAGRYGTPTKAWAHSEQYGWY